MTTEELRKYIYQEPEKWKAIRRDLHKIPELSGKEYKTQEYIINRLNKLGIENRKCGGTGVYAIIRTGRSGNTLAFRADIDGLPIQEQNKTEYTSVHDGCMHACGHDVHTTFLLGLAEVLKAFEKELCGNIVFLFQPAEENISGAELMINDGALDEPQVDALIASHVWNLPFGQIVVKKGPIMASPIFFEIDIKGLGGHGANPHLCHNPISIAAHIINAVENCAATMIDPLEPVVISFCSINGGDCNNAIPLSIKMTGTIRTYSDRITKQLEAAINLITENISKAYNAASAFKIVSSASATINDSKLAAWAYDELSRVFTEKDVINDINPAMTGEDFGMYGEKVPSLYLWIGVNNNEKGKVYDLHNCRFDIDENILPKGIYAFALLALKKCRLN